MNLHTIRTNRSEVAPSHTFRKLYEVCGGPNSVGNPGPIAKTLMKRRGVRLRGAMEAVRQARVEIGDYGGWPPPKWTRASETARTHELRQREARVLDPLSSSERIQCRMGIHLGYCDGCIAEARQVLPPTARATSHAIYSKLEKAGLRRPGGEGKRRSKDSCRMCHPAPRPAPLRIPALAPIRRVA